MSQASKQVDWCIKKAQKELGDCEERGLKPKHRGLIVVPSDVQEAKKHLGKAEHDLRVSEYLVKGEFTDTSVSTLFYAMYQCFLAISSKFGYESGNQTCTISLIEYLIEENKIAVDKRFVGYFKYETEERIKNSIIEMREQYTYGSEVKVEKSKIDFFIKECKELIDLTKSIIYE